MFGLPEALMSFIRRQVGLRTDVASATGSLHAKVGDMKNTLLLGVVPAGCVASDTVRFADLVEEGGAVGNGYVDIWKPIKKAKIFKNGSVRVSYAYIRYNMNAAVNVAVNGVNVGIEHSSGSEYRTAAEDIRVAFGDTVAIVIKASVSDRGALIKDFKFSFDDVDVPAVGVTKV